MESLWPQHHPVLRPRTLKHGTLDLDSCGPFLEPSALQKVGQGLVKDPNIGANVVDCSRSRIKNAKEL